jgi:hypothetical protein
MSAALPTVLANNPAVGAAPKEAAETERHQLGRDVTILVQDDMARLLDLERGHFYALNATGTHLLTLALQHGPDQAIAQVAGEHGIDETWVRADWAKLLDRLRKKHLLATQLSTRRRTLPGRFNLWFLLALAWISLRLVGWARTIRWWRRGRPARAQPWQTRLTPLVQQLDQTVRVAAATHPLNPQCKERALVAWHLLRNRWGLAAELVVGVLAFPFEAHAWVECGPLTVTDNQDRCAMYMPAARYS